MVLKEKSVKQWGFFVFVFLVCLFERERGREREGLDWKIKATAHGSLHAFNSSFIQDIPRMLLKTLLAATLADI